MAFVGQNTMYTASLEIVVGQAVLKILDLASQTGRAASNGRIIIELNGRQRRTIFLDVLIGHSHLSLVTHGRLPVLASAIKTNGKEYRRSMILCAGIILIKFDRVSQNKRLPKESIEHRFMLYVTWYLGLDKWIIPCCLTS
jgi:hypothetical protein